jgi:hypothetical protein
MLKKSSSSEGVLNESRTACLTKFLHGRFKISLLSALLVMTCVI